MNFWKVFGATLLALFVGTVLSWMVQLFFFAGMLGAVGLGDIPVITPQTIVKIDFGENILDSPARMPVEATDLASMNLVQNTHLLKVLKGIEAAKKDSNVKGLYLNFSDVGSVETSALEEIRAAILDFKKSGKFVVAYNESYSHDTYYVASAADKVYMHPEGDFSWVGLANTTLFVKGAFDNLGLNAEAIRPTECKYKSAVEPFLLTEMSPENRAQMQLLVDDMWDSLLKKISESRNIKVDMLKFLANYLEVILAEDALKHGFVDGLIYEDEMEQKFAEYGVFPSVGNNDYNIVTLNEYLFVAPPRVNLTANAVAVVYANGEIVDGEGFDELVYSSNLVNQLREIRKDNYIKAVVLRVNSPGGSALASDVIWREVDLLRKVKPVVVSMGSYAASGGYYISANADKIVADELTLTGSIGVFGLLVEGKNMFNEKLGITTDEVKTSPSADFNENLLGVSTRKITDDERKVLLRAVDKVYDSFLSKVSDGRSIDKEALSEIAQGRIWSGSRAKELGLVDEIGGILDAISIAADLAGIPQNSSVVEFLEKPIPIEEIMMSLGAPIGVTMLDKDLGEAMKLYKSIRRECSREGVQAFCPYTFGIN